MFVTTTKTSCNRIAGTLRAGRLAAAALAVLAVCTVAHAQQPPTGVAPQYDLSNPAEHWPWGFGKNGQPGEPAEYDHVLYVDDVAENGDGTADKPFNDLGSAVNEAAKRMKSMEMRRDTRVKDVSLPLWLRMTRKADLFTLEVAADENGAPGAWQRADNAVLNAGQGRRIDMPESYYAGLLIYPDHGWPQKPTTAKVDHVTLNGQPVNHWETAEFARGDGSHEVADGVIALSGTRGERMKKHDWDDEGYFLYVPVTGDAEMIVRVVDLAPSAKTHKGSVGLMMRENSRRNGRMSMVELYSREKDGSTDYEVSGYYRKHREQPGGSVKIIVREGVHYFGDIWSSVALPVRDDIADDLFFCIEGEANGGTGKVILSGSEPPAAWEPATWTKIAEGVYRHEWTGGERGDATKRVNEAIIALTPAGAGTDQRVHLNGVDADKWASEPGTFTLKDGQVLMALPEGWSAQQFDGALVEVANRAMSAMYCNPLAGMTPNRGPGSNVIWRNLVMEHFDKPVHLNGYSGPYILNRNWLLEDVTFRNNNQSAIIRFIRDFTLRRVTATGAFNKGGIGTIVAEGEVIDCDFSHNDGGGWYVADKNMLIMDTRIEGNQSHGIRMDHMAENLWYENVTIADNHGQGGVYETATGPVTFHNCTIRNNLAAEDDWKGNDGQFGLAMAQNFTFDNCTFEYSEHAAFSIYPRMRSHWPIDSQYDKPGTLALPPNSMDWMQWSRLRERGADPELLCQPNGEKPGSFNPNLIVRNCTFKITGKDTLFYGQHHWERDEATDRVLKKDLIAYNNEYHSADNPTPFALAAKPGWNWGEETLGDWAQWKANGNPDAMYWDDSYTFEAGSSFNGPAPRDFTPAERTLAEPGNSSEGQADGNVIRYEVEKLPFTTNGPVELREDADASGGVYHKLLVDQMGDYGQFVEYTIDVPEDGDYYVTVKYLRNEGPFEYLGFAQLTVDAETFFDRWPNNIDSEYNPFSPEHMYWDQSGLTKEFTSVPLGKMHLTAGEHRFRFDPAWKDGYIAGDYDITVDAIELSTELNPMPAVDVNDDVPGLRWDYYKLDEGLWFARLPDYDRMQSELSGVFDNIGLMAGDDHFGYRFTGYLDVPETGIYTFTLAVHGMANLYIDGKRIIDCDGPHGYHDKEAEEADRWYKYGRVALEQGKHAIRIDFRNHHGQQDLKLLWQAGDAPRQPVPDAAFTHQRPAQ